MNDAVCIHCRETLDEIPVSAAATTTQPIVEASLVGQEGLGDAQAVPSASEFELVICPICKTRVQPKKGSICPACQSPIEMSTSFAVQPAAGVDKQVATEVLTDSARSSTNPLSCFVSLIIVLVALAVLLLAVFNFVTDLWPLKERPPERYERLVPGGR